MKKRGVKPGTKRGPYKTTPNPETACVFKLRVSEPLHQALRAADKNHIRHTLNTTYLKP